MTGLTHVGGSLIALACAYSMEAIRMMPSDRQAQADLPYLERLLRIYVPNEPMRIILGAIVRERLTLPTARLLSDTDS